MATYLPAMRAKMGDLEYFVSIATFGETARMVEYVEDADSWTPETPSELKLQRKLNIQRVEREMVPYLLANDDHFFSALTVEVRPTSLDHTNHYLGFTSQTSFPGGIEFGTLTLDGTESLCAIDGQHRLKAIELAIRRKPELAREHIALILIPYHSIARSQTLFSDLNRYAKGPSKSLSILFTHREPLARIAKRLANSVPLLRDRVNMESSSLSANSRHFITLSTLYEMTRVLAGDALDSGERSDDLVIEDLSEVWELLTRSIEQWQITAEGREHPAYLRQRYLCMHGLAQQAIASATAEARKALGPNWVNAISKFRLVDWRLVNPEWEGIILQGGRVNNTATSVQLLTHRLEEVLGIPA